MFWNGVICDFQVGKFDKFFVSESHALRVSGVSKVIGFMTLQHIAICIRLHCSQTVCHKSRETSLAAFNCECSSSVHIDSMFTRQTTMHHISTNRCLSRCRLATDVCIFVSTRPTDRPRTFAVCHRLPDVAQELAPRIQ